MFCSISWFELSGRCFLQCVYTDFKWQDVVIALYTGTYPKLVVVNVYSSIKSTRLTLVWRWLSKCILCQKLWIFHFKYLDNWFLLKQKENLQIPLFRKTRLSYFIQKIVQTCWKLSRANNQDHQLLQGIHDPLSQW